MELGSVALAALSGFALAGLTSLLDSARHDREGRPEPGVGLTADVGAGEASGHLVTLSWPEPQAALGLERCPRRSHVFYEVILA